MVVTSMSASSLGLTPEASMALDALVPLLSPSFPSQRRQLSFCFPFHWGKKDKGDNEEREGRDEALFLSLFFFLLVKNSRPAQEYYCV
jgi:hypothetical protein